jgi:hypothetical protein
MNLARFILKNFFSSGQELINYRTRGFPSPVLFSAFGCQAVFGSEQRTIVLCKHSTCKENTDRDRLLQQQPIHLQEKEENKP